MLLLLELVGLAGPSFVRPSVGPSFHATFLQFSVLAGWSSAGVSPYGLTISSCKLCIISQDFSVCREIPWWQDLEFTQWRLFDNSIPQSILERTQQRSCDCELKQVSKKTDLTQVELLIFIRIFLNCSKW